MYEIEFYDLEDGSTPVQEFPDSLEPKCGRKFLGQLTCWSRMDRHSDCSILDRSMMEFLS